QRLRHHAGNPLHLDVLVVDEAAMIGLPLMPGRIAHSRFIYHQHIKMQRLRHHAGNPLHLDVLVVDEAAMIG
ncbi:hypothetical protein PSY22_23530, partial [Shigella flexneri]|nr:hypothetical protein [Shigella flexneri]